VHGIWINSYFSWNYTNFNKTLENSNFNISFADYGKYNATTFDPNYNKTGNYGIDSIRNTTKDILKKYNENGISASQVDIIAHSMGGLMARGFTQQSDYKNENNSMKGYIHRLITIGTPHFGSQLAKILYDNRDKDYCYKWSGTKLYLTTTKNCSEKQQLKLKDIYKSPPAPKFSSLFEEGGLEALEPNSTAYQHLNKTIVPSYAIIGDWKQNAKNSSKYLEDLYKNITRDPHFNLEGKEGFGEDNDLQVNITSQLRGLLDNKLCNTENKDIYMTSKIYNNTVHGSIFIHNDTNVYSELNSPLIQKDVISLLNSSNDKFSP